MKKIKIFNYVEPNKYQLHALEGYNREAVRFLGKYLKIHTLSAVINCPMPTFEGYLHPFLKITVSIFLWKVKNRASVILRIFLISRPIEPHDSYKKNSYKKSVYIAPFARVSSSLEKYTPTFS